MEVMSGRMHMVVSGVHEEWNAKPLEGFISISHGFAFESEHFASNGSYRLMTPGNFHEEGGFRDVGDKQKFYLGKIPNDYILAPGDLVVAMTEQADGLLGSAALVPEPGYLHNQRIGRVTALSSDIDLGYLYYVFNSARYRSKVRETAAGTKVKHTSPGKLLEIVIPIPSPPEQRAIATALSDMDALLCALESLIAKKRDLKQAAMQQLLTGNTRLPGFNGEWAVKRLGEICDISIGRTPPRLNSAMWGDGHVWLSIADLKSKVVSESKEQITAFAAESMTVVPKGTLLMSFKLSIGRLCFAGCDLFTNEAICSFNNLQEDADFLYYALGRTDFSLYGKQAVKGYTLNKESLNLVEVRLPSAEEQIAIATVIADIDAELTALEARRDKTRALKQAMMQELLTGKTRLVSREVAHA
jgi:type I restriction enzyme S subunit